MENELIIQTLKLTASLMELHEGDPFKIKGLQSATFKLDQLNEPLSLMTLDKLEKLDGVGKSIAGKISEIITTGNLTELQDLAQKTPKGVIEMLSIKGLGPKKVRTIWKDLDIIHKEDLLKACQENRISALKGFGEKTQEAIKQALLFSQEHKDKFMYMEVEVIAYELQKQIEVACPGCDVEVTGDIRRRMEIVETLQFVVGSENPLETIAKIDQIVTLSKDMTSSAPFAWRGTDLMIGAKVEIKVYRKEEFQKKLLLHSCDPDHLKARIKDGLTLGQYLKKATVVSEQDFYRELGLQYIEPEMREGMNEVEKAKKGEIPSLLTDDQLKGVLHNHTTYSDGIHTLEQMAEFCVSMGYEYLGITDHSKAAFYANGLQENRVIQQQSHIDEVNKRLSPFKIFKGIESDILNDGSLDYEDDILATFDFIVASIHSNQKMTEDKAMERLTRAIENPYTTILGHPTGRLLLRREGYPINHKKIIDACIQNNVVIEINANPRRLDMDWRWVIYALEKGAWISVNPDAHSMQEFMNMRYGVLVGRKAGLSKERTFNALSRDEVEKHFLSKKATVASKV